MIRQDNSNSTVKTVTLPAHEVLDIVQRLLQFPLPTICRHAVAADLLSALEAHGYPVSNELAGAVVRAEDDVALKLLRARHREQIEAGKLPQAADVVERAHPAGDENASRSCPRRSSGPSFSP